MSRGHAPGLRWPGDLESGGSESALGEVMHVATIVDFRDLDQFWEALASNGFEDHRMPPIEVGTPVQQTAMLVHLCLCKNVRDVESASSLIRIGATEHLRELHEPLLRPVRVRHSECRVFDLVTESENGASCETEVRHESEVLEGRT